MKKIFLILSLFVCLKMFGQTYNPSQSTVSNKPYGMAQFGPTDARAYFYDAPNFVYRAYKDTIELLAYLNLSKYRSGQVLYVVNSGGTLSGGVITGGTNSFWWFKNGTADVNLIPFASGSGTAGLTNLTSTPGGGITLGITNPTTTPNITPSVTLGGDISGTTLAAVTVAKLNGQLPSFYLNYNNLTNTPSIPAQFNPIAGTGISLSGTYPNITFSNTGSGFTTAGVFLKAISSSTVGIDTLNYRKVDTIYSVNDSVVNYTLNGRTYTLSIRGGTGSGGGGGTGTVTTVSVVTANGVSGSVANPTSTPAITLTLGAITPTTVNALTLAAGASLFTITGGTGTPRTLTVNGNATVSGTNTGDVTLAGETYITIAGQVITANPVNVSGTNITGVLKATAFPALTGPITTSAGALGTSVTNNAITNAMLAQMPQHTFKGNNTGGTANALDLTATQLTAELNVFTSTLKGLVPLSGGGTTNFLRADGTFAAPPGVVYSAGFGINATSLASAIIALDTASLKDTIHITYLGTIGDTLVKGSRDTLSSPRIRDSLGFHHTINPDGSWTLYASGGGGGSTTQTITCTACGFIVGNVVSKNLTTWVKADTISNYPDGVISQVVDANTFVVTTSGPMTWTSGLTIGSNYYQSTTSGVLTVTSPVISIPIGKPIATTIFLVAIQRGFNFTASGGGGGGNPNSNVGAGFRLAVTQTNNVKTLFSDQYGLYDSTTNTNGITLSILGAPATRMNVAQATHGFTQGQVVSWNGSSYVLADTISNFANGIVSAVIDANNFTLVTSGLITGWTHGLTLGSIYFNSTTAGNLTATSPVVSIPIGKAITSTTFLVSIQRGFNFSATNIALTANHIFVGSAGAIATDVAMSGDATIVSAGTLTIANNAVTNAKAAQMAQHTFKGNNTGSTANALDLTATQLTAELNTFTSSLKGLVSPPGSPVGNVLSDNGTWVANGGGVSSVTNADGSLTFSPTTGAVVGSLNINHQNTWTAPQIFAATPSISTMSAKSILFIGAAGLVSQDAPNFTYDGTLNQIKINRNNIGTTLSDVNGVLVSNATAAIVSLNQQSNNIVWSGSGWKTNATAGAQTTNAVAYLLPVTGAASPTSQWILAQNTNGGAYQNNLVVGSNSVIMANNNANQTGFYLGNGVNPFSPETTSFAGLELGNGGTGEIRLWVHASDFLTLYSSGAEAARFFTNGNHAIGVTADNAAVLQLKASTATNANMFFTGSAVDVTSPTNGMLWYNSTTHALNFRDNGGTINLLSSAGTPTFQQVLTAGSTMTGNNTVNTAGNSFTFATGTAEYSGMPTPKNLSSFLSSAFTSGVTLANAFRMNQTVATSGSAQVSQFYAKTSNASGTVGAAWGNLSIVEHAGAGVLTIGRAYQAEVLMTGGGTMTEATGIETSGGHISGTGTITNSYGIFIDQSDPGSGTITNRYGIWQDDPAELNVFKGIMRFDNVPDASGTVSVLTRQANNTISKMGIAAASYTPTLTNSSNITSSTLEQASYTRIGNIVTVVIGGSITPTSSTGVVITFSLPIATSDGTQNFCGQGVDNMTASWIPGMVSVVSTTTATFSFIATSSGFAQAFSVTFQYSL